MTPDGDMSPSGQRARYAPLYDIDPRTGVSIEIFYRSMETFGRCGAGWFWWPRRRGCSPDRSAIGPFATCYAAYRHALGAHLGAACKITCDTVINSGS